MANIPVINHQKLIKYIKLYYRKRLPLFIWGTFGIGKSYSVLQAGREIAEEIGLKFSSDFQHINDPEYFNVLVIPMHQLDVSELKGLPFPDRGRRVTEFFRMNWLPKEGQGIIFLDELNLAPPLVQSNAYQLILDRRIGDYTLPDGYYVIGAGNTAEDKAHIIEFAEPLKNRFAGHYLLKIPTAEEWVRNYAIPHHLDERVISFLLWRDDLIHTYNPENDSTETISVASPRTWEFVSNIISDIPDDDLETIEELVGAGVGVEVAREFIAFLKLRKSVDVAEIFRNPDKFVAPEPPQSDISETYATISAIISYYKKNMDRKDMPEKMVRILMKFKAEHVMYGIHLIKEYDPEFVKKISKLPVFKDFTAKYLKYAI